jgi:dephospho-CoA kinase
MTISVGITGGIGSGKSTVCEIFKLLGAPVFEADKEAKRLLNINSEVRLKLINLYGDDIYAADGTINRKKLAGIIFNNDIQLSKVNEIVHPVVRTEYFEWIKKQDYAYVIHEAAILFESGFYKMMDFTILVSAPEDVRIKRVARRDHLTFEQVRERIANQWSDEQKRELASFEITNDNKKLIIPQLVKIDKQLKEYGKIW